MFVHVLGYRAWLGNWRQFSQCYFLEVSVTNLIVSHIYMTVYNDSDILCHFRLYLSVKLMFAVSLFISYGLQFYVPMNIVWPFIIRKTREKNVNVPPYMEHVLRVCIVLFTCKFLICYNLYPYSYIYGLILIQIWEKNIIII